MRRCVVIALLALLLSACAAPTPTGPRYVVFFQRWSGDLDEPARAAIGGAAAWAKAHPDTRVLVRGYADTEGSMAANEDVTSLRAQLVSDLLVADGVNAARIQRSAAGSVPFPGQESQTSRRAEIVFAAP